jgi:drug/metabolite transporter superfamily protein YnfA
MKTKTQNKKTAKRSLLISIVLIALGVTLMNMNESTKTPGIVFIAIGGLFLIIAFARKKLTENNKSN